MEAKTPHCRGKQQHGIYKKEGNMSAGGNIKPRKAPARNRTGLPGVMGLVSHAGYAPLRRRPLYKK